MQKKSQEDYRTAVSDALIGHREDLRVHRNTLSDHGVTLDDHTTTLANHATELETIGTEQHATSAVISHPTTGVLYAFAVEATTHLIKYAIRPYGGSWGAWASSGLHAYSGISASWDGNRSVIWISYRWSDGFMKVVEYNLVSTFTAYTPIDLSIQ